MAKLALIYGMRLLPEEDLGELKDATVILKNGRTARITMHLIEGSKEEIEATFHQSVQAFLKCIRRFEARRNLAITEIFGVGVAVAEIVVDQNRGLACQFNAFAAFVAR